MTNLHYLNAPRMTTKTKIYIDIDDVLCETGKAFVNLLQQEFGKSIRFEQITDFDLGASFCLEPQDLTRFMQRAHEPEVLLSMQALEGASETVSRWHRSGCEVHLVTGRPYSTRDTSLRWLREVSIPFSQLIFVDKYSRHIPVDGDRDVMSLDELRVSTYDLAIEDAPKMARLMAEEVAEHVVLFDRPWNRTLLPAKTRSGNRMIRCRSWAEIDALYPLGPRTNSPKTP